MPDFSSTKPATRLLVCTLALWSLSLSVSLPQAIAQPSQKPLLTNQSGAKPNLMITLDNSGSMAFGYHESYGVPSDSNLSMELRKCKDNQWSDLTGAWIPGGMADFRYQNRCIFLQGAQYYYTVVDQSEAYTPQRLVTGGWSAQRSSDVNPVYYNPRTTYHPRVDAKGKPLLPTDGYTWISNQTSTSVEYTVHNNSEEKILVQHSMFAESPTTVPADYTRAYGFTFPWRIPKHVAYKVATTSMPGFTYSYCSKVITWSGMQAGCADGAWKDVTVNYDVAGTVQLPSGHQRTCKQPGVNTCSFEEERTNILNWYRYYAFRAPAVATAIGQALANNNAYDNLRLGYLTINRRIGATVPAMDKTPGIDTNNPTLMRGVRLYKKESIDIQQFYSWLYDQDGSLNGTSDDGKDPGFNSTAARHYAPYGGTPLHNAIEKVANYYKVGTDAKENPWAKDPGSLASDTNREVSCRRSFNLLFSDGAWNAGTTSIAGSDYDNSDSKVFERTLTNGTTESFQYLHTGGKTEEARRAYTPFPSTGTGGLADLTAKYFWHTDLRSELANDGKTRASQPTFWQNMTTYTVGYLIRPSGEIPGANSGLTFDQAKLYQSQFATDGYDKAAKPAWAVGDLNAATTSDQSRVDDFIQAGFTGGGKGFSARTADDIRKIFDSILSEILNAAGRDAGVAVSGGDGSSSLADKLKYGVSYRTVENTGEIEATPLDPKPIDAPKGWKASEQIGPHAGRAVFTMSTTNGSTVFAGKLSALPADVRAALKPPALAESSRIPDDERFIDYLRGKDPVSDASGVLFRQRTSRLGAIVNSPPLYMSGARDFAYDLGSTVDGKDFYEAYVKAKIELPPSLFVPTNAGAMHALDAKTGRELAAFMPRQSLSRMLNYANVDYNFEYTLDGPLSEHDIYDGTRWNHIAMGTGGRGEQLLYAVRSPLNQGAAPNRTPGQSDFLWESGPGAINNMDFTIGHMTNPIRSGQSEHGEWIAVVNSGHLNGNVDGSKHGLVVLNALTGALIRAIPLPATPAAGSAEGKTDGLGGVTLVRNADKRIVAAYAGDAKGNLWRFDLRGAPANWGVSYNKPLFTTANNRPIYGSPAWQAHPKGGTIVVIATGILLSDKDLDPTVLNPDDVAKGAKEIIANEAIYGVWDPTPIGKEGVADFTTVPQDALLTQTVLEDTSNVVDNNTFYRASKNAIDWKKHRGWTLPLARAEKYKGERSLDQIRNVGKAVLIATTVITAQSKTDEESCSAAALPLNFLYALNALDGSSTRLFVTKRNEKVEYASVVLAGDGGYSRGIALVRTNLPQTESSRQYLAVDGQNGEGVEKKQGGGPPPSCRPEKLKTKGTEKDSFDLNLECPGWSRAQYQLSRPPSN